jgi:hypothetical protein
VVHRSYATTKSRPDPEPGWAASANLEQARRATGPGCSAGWRYQAVVLSAWPPGRTPGATASRPTTTSDSTPLGSWVNRYEGTVRPAWTATPISRLRVE